MHTLKWNECFHTVRVSFNCHCGHTLESPRKISKRLSISGSPMGMCLEDCLNWFNGGGRTMHTVGNIIFWVWIPDCIKVEEASWATIMNAFYFNLLLTVDLVWLTASGFQFLPPAWTSIHWWTIWPISVSLVHHLFPKVLLFGLVFL